MLLIEFFSRSGVNSFDFIKNQIKVNAYAILREDYYTSPIGSTQNFLNKPKRGYMNTSILKEAKVSPGKMAGNLENLDTFT